MLAKCKSDKFVVALQTDLPKLRYLNTENFQKVGNLRCKPALELWL
jgi:hypothetical protein